MNDKYQIGQFGKFEWKREVKDTLVVDGVVKKITRKYPYSIEGAQIKDIDSKYIYIEDMMDVAYVVPMSSCVYTPMDVRK